MSTMVENVIAAGADNRPPMLEKSQYNSWQSRMKLYIQGKEQGKELLDSVLHVSFKYGTVVVPDPTSYLSLAIHKTRTYVISLTNEKIVKNVNMELNMVFRFLPPDVYTLVNHHTDAKEIWDRVKILIEGIKLSLQERESKLYNEFDRLTYEKRESIHYIT
ncbi:hypothetical protein Tco_1048695 [Tanacetum coccineum]